MPTLKINAGSLAVNLKVQGLAGILPPSLRLASDDGEWSVTVPRASFGNMPAEAGEVLVVSISLVRVAVQDELPRPKLPIFGKDLTNG